MQEGVWVVEAAVMVYYPEFDEVCGSRAGQCWWCLVHS